MQKPIAFASAGGLARLAHAQNPAEFLTVAAGASDVFNEPLYAHPPEDKNASALLAWITELAQNHPTRLRSMYVDGRPVGQMLVERIGAGSAKNSGE